MKTIRAPYQPRGGVHPRYHKELSASAPIFRLPLLPLLRVSMSQHLGPPARPVVKKGDTVTRGQIIGEATGYVSAHVHAPTSGRVRGIVDALTPTGAYAPAVEIEPDGQDTWASTIQPCSHWEDLDPRELVRRVAEAGIVGMGGAGFPTHVKLSPPAEKPIRTLIINGAECEPYLTADHRLMVERAADICTGARIIRRILGGPRLWFAVEDNKPDAIAALEQALGAGGNEDVGIVRLKTKYPQGAEKQLIFAVCGLEVPTGGLPMDVGCLVENVATTLAVWDAVVNGRPLVERVVTVTGSAVARPANLLVRVGTTYADLLLHCGTNGPVAKIIAGGPMMGLAQPALEIGIAKTTSGLLLLPPDFVSVFTSVPCIGCGRCVGACPMRLLPSELSKLLEAEDYDGAEANHVMDCIECGCCAYMCPAHRPLVQHMKQGKARVIAKRAAKASRKTS